jgi:hypothetical protein
LLPAPYYHLVFTLPAPVSDIAYQNKAEIYDILFKASAETLITIAADPKHLGARIGVTSVLQGSRSVIERRQRAIPAAREWLLLDRRPRSLFGPALKLLNMLMTGPNGGASVAGAPT